MSLASDKNSVFTCEFIVSKDDTDQNRHVNNVVYVKWMQNIAIQHSDTSGVTRAVQALNCIWVVHSHRIEYLSPAFALDVIKASTWVEKYLRVKAVRQYRFLRKSDGKILASGETEWVFIDVEKGKPCTIPEQVRNCCRPADKV